MEGSKLCQLISEIGKTSRTQIRVSKRDGNKLVLVNRLYFVYGISKQKILGNLRLPGIIYIHKFDVDFEQKVLILQKWRQCAKSAIKCQFTKKMDLDDINDPH